MLTGIICRGGGCVKKKVARREEEISQTAGRFSIRLASFKDSARTLSAPSPKSLGGAVHHCAAFPASARVVRRTHPKTDVVVTVVRIVVVAIRTAGVPMIVVEGAAAENASFFGQALHANRLHGDSGVTDLSQPPSRRPSSTTISEACLYWPGLIHPQRSHNRR
jgi:hypothetical protein